MSGDYGGRQGGDEVRGEAAGTRTAFTQKGLQFFLKIGIPREKIRCAVHIHPGLPKDIAEEYWRQVTGLPQSQFHMTRDAVSRASSGRKVNLQVYGTCQLRANDTKVRQKLSKWMELALSSGPLV